MGRPASKSKKKLSHQADPVLKGTPKHKETLTSRQKKRLKKRLTRVSNGKLGSHSLELSKTEAVHEVEPLLSSKKELFSLDDKHDSDDELIGDDFGNLDELESQSDLSEPSHHDDESMDEKQPPEQLDQEEPEKTTSQDLTYLDQRIRDWMLMLSDFKNRAPPDLKRKSCINSLLDDICKRYSYNKFLAHKFFDLFPKDLIEFIEANEIDRPVTLRTNTLKTRRRELAQALINRGVNLDPLEPWSRVGLVVYSSQVPLGATPEYLAGHYILQGASSMLPVMALAPKPGERILDLCAAPGGKATYIAQLMKNTGTLFANELNPTRAKALIGNCHRMGIVNTIVCVEDGRKFPNLMSNFDRVLLDAPCSGTGIIAKDHSVKASKTNEDIQRCATLQKELILAAVDACKPGGYIVYSTCSILVEENEAIIWYAMKKRKLAIVETKLFGENGFINFKGFHFHPKMERTRRYYPHKHNVDGFFVAKLKRLA
ncbi:rRNA (cytosine-C5-)-methyltransferase nop2 [Clonorchis sinensis]|uniref:rRNA (Cytosine-C5-)-methyltransferase nop2 n=1 Tax=Clonorchis sinensis TaxID=79923 RepID=A0A8T1MHE3_CLOSI|nr:rRNA (cytosine-C5-)-methyltransferase nop2 [Clonorchis sinensis]